MKVVFTGGHPSPAFACIEYIREAYPEWELLFVGREVSQPGSGQLAWERQTAAEYGVPFVGIDTCKSSVSGREVFSHGTKIVQSVFKSLELIRNEKPDVCLSFGSYVAVPIALACKIAGVPVVTHEQVLGAGRASRFIGKFANAIAVSHEESIKYFPARKCVVTGLPLRPVLFKRHPQPAWLQNVPPDLPIVVVMGGSFSAALEKPPVGGHNPLEPARLGKPVVTGPDASNWTGVTRMLKQAGGLVSVLSPAELPGVVAPLLADPDAARDMGERARRAAADAAAGLDRLWLALQAYLPAAPSRGRR